jgi:hypothetical protein
MDPHDVLRVSAGIAAGASALATTELLAAIRDYDRGGVFDCGVNPVSLRLERWWARLSWPPPAPTYRVVRVFAVLRLIAAGALLVPGLPALALGVSAAIALVTGAVIARFSSGYTEFGDQMVKVVLGGAAVGWLGGSETTVRWSVWFIAAQACLAYSAAGSFKLVSPTWRSGAALWTILSMEQTGHPPVGRWLSQRPGWSRALSWGTIVWEATFPLVLIAPPWLLWMWLAAGAIFHLGCAFLMGLNTYLWSFIATYPAVIFVNSSLHAWWAAR